VTRTFRQAIDGAPSAVFPLLCPVREVEWLDGWAYRMICSASGMAEAGAVFATSAPGEADTLWVVTCHDAAVGVVEFCRVTPGSRTCLLRIAVSPRDAGQSWVDVSYEYTSIAPAGDVFLDQWTGDAFLDAMRAWESSMNHFLATGERLSRRADRIADADASS
jgi:hypothetical protein